MITEIITESKNDIEQIIKVIAPVAREKISKVNSRLNQTVWKFDNSVKLFVQNQDHQLKRKEEIVRGEFKISHNNK